MKKQQGFTLIEIIAVLVILGILAAVAIPKYNNLQDQARIRGAQGIIAGAMSQLSLSYSNALINDAIDPAALGSSACDDVAVTGDYTLSCAGDTDLTQNITITVTHAGMDPQTEVWQSPES